jgi:hypothetical protein
MRWEGHVGNIREKRNVYRVLVGKREGKRPLEYLCIDGRITLKYIFMK